METSSRARRKGRGIFIVLAAALSAAIAAIKPAFDECHEPFAVLQRGNSDKDKLVSEKEARGSARTES